MNSPNGVITFFSSSHALHAESVLKAAGYEVELVPGPKDISPNCGVAIRYEYLLTAQIKGVLDGKGVLYEACHLYAINQQKSLIDKLLGR